ncbi:L-gulonolactone oxidase 5 [Pseudolycoriella hygida]|uniref:L-gulonolactone oxidase 5 n=1 Tax=Pseudolycoriella hygida TaxID=35572 RepID=A0A9Q0MNW8_9DIPT|nr:L-gulonolactone oxidase 5 [Pseudolycoriella hygida]
MNDDGVHATFGAGVNLHEATTFLRKHNRGLRTTPAYGNITFGGATGTGAHGSSIKYNASISSQIVSMRIVDGLGNPQDITDPEDLKAFRLHLGLLGIVVKITVYTVPLYKTLANNYVISDEILTNGKAIEMAQNADQMAFYWFPAFNQLVVANWTIVDANTEGNAYTYDHVPSVYKHFGYIATIAKEAAFSLTTSTCALASSIGYTILHAISYFLELALIHQVPGWVPIYTENGFLIKMPAVGYYDVMFAPICHDTPQGFLQETCVWDNGPNNITILDNEFGVDLPKLPSFIAKVKDIVNKTPTAFPLQGILMRFSDKSDIYMSTAYGSQTVHFEFYLWNRRDPYNEPSGSLAGYQTILQMLRNEYSSRSHWGKSGLVYHNSDSLDLKLDPAARDGFTAVMTKYDPNGVFLNSFGHRLKKTGTKVDLDPMVKHCALLDNCFCSADGDCGKNQICTKISGYNYNVCQTKNEIPVDFFPHIILPKENGTGLLNFFSTEVQAIANALQGKCSITSLISAIGDTAGNTFKAFIIGLGSQFSLG